jgi:F0F1-type ATP synthase assembly protein I
LVTWFFLVKVIVSALVIAVVTEIAKVSTSIGGLIAAMPFITVMSLIWFYTEKKDSILMADFTISVFWGIFPTLLSLLPAIYLFRKGYNFFHVLFISFIFLAIGVYIHQYFIKG